ncbi:MAG: hypothetical protein WHS83_04010 [Chloroflexus sp.]|uniref:hypothetical protein n=1 Tax=Chloroflexus sp. TaxID=1904827 RepID=UPI003096106E
MMIGRLRLAILVLYATLSLPIIQWVWPSPIYAQSGVSLEVFTPFAGQYVVGEWLPVRATLRNAGATITATITGSPADDPAQYARVIRIPTGGQETIWLYVWIRQPARAVTITVSANNVILAQQELPLLLRPTDRMRAVLGESPVSGDLFATGSLQVADLPDHALGLSNLSVLALLELSEPLSPSQQSALLAWVHNGGHLIVGGGPDAITLQTNLPSTLQAAQVAGVAALDRQPLADLAEVAFPNPLIGLKLQPVHGAYAIGNPTAAPWIEYPVGHGRVTQLAFSPDSLNTWAGRDLFWSALAQPVLLAQTTIGSSAQLTSRQVEALRPALSILPDIDIPVFGQSFLALTIYALVVIPFLVGIWWWRHRVLPVTILSLVAVISSGSGLWWANTNAAPAYTSLRLTLIEQIDNQQAIANTALVMLSAMPRAETVSFTSPAFLRPLSTDADPNGDAMVLNNPMFQETAQIAVQLAPWEQQSLLASMVIPALPIQATLVIDQERLRVDLQNDSSVTLRNTYIMYGDQLIFFGNLRPGARSVARWPAVFAEAPVNASPGQLIINDLRENGLLPNRNIEQLAFLRTTFIDAAVRPVSERFDPGPFLITWLERDPTTLTSPDGWSETLLVIRPRIVGRGQLILPVGWLRIDPKSTQTAGCLNDNGVLISNAAGDVHLRLPADLAQLQAEVIQVHVKTVDPLADRQLVIQAYNWQTANWSPVTATDPSRFTIESAAAYLRNGELRLRFSNSFDQPTCIVVTGGVQGVVP